MRPRGSGLSRWVLLPAGLFAALVLVTVFQELTGAPSGAPAGLDLSGFVLPRLRGDLLVVSLLAASSQAGFLVLPRRLRRAAGLGLFSLLGAAGLVVLLVAIADGEVYQYISERLDLVMLTDYRMARSPAFTGRILLAGVVFLGPALAALLAFALLFARLARRPDDELPSPRCALTSLLVFLLSVAAFTFLPVPADTWRQAQPPAWHLFVQALSPGGSSKIPGRFSDSVKALEALSGKPQGPGGSGLYPLWHEAPDEAASYVRFRSRPPAEKPDILVVVFESLRGWEADFRDPDSAERFPALHRLFAERGREFVRFQSNGYPSIEGWASLFLGIWPHPNHLILGRDLDKRLVSLPEILGRAGYWRAIVSPEPLGDIHAWYARWYDVVRLSEHDSDAETASRLLERYDGAPADQPRLMTWGTVSTHPPFVPPRGVAYPGEPGDRRQYLAAAAETDRVLGTILDHLRASGRWDRTIVVVTGDHSTSNGWIALRTPRIGTPNAGETWTPLIWAPPGGPEGVIDERVRSHVDVAPTLLAALGLDVSNHFMGRDLFDPGDVDLPVVALHLGGVAVTQGSLRFHFRLDDPAFFRKFQWDVPIPPTKEDGSYRHGEDLPATAEEREEMARIGGIVSAYGYLVSEDRVAPARAVGAGRPARGRTGGPGSP